MIHVAGAWTLTNRKGGTEVEIKKRRREDRKREERDGREGGGEEDGQERTRIAEKRVRRFTSLYATHLLRIDSLSGHLFSRISSLNTVHTTRVHDANTNVHAWCERGRASARLV